ncbi:MAG TPA: hypothetical protein VGG61_02350, partial [Gemmataceae bacterium]
RAGFATVVAVLLLLFISLVILFLLFIFIVLLLCDSLPSSCGCGFTLGNLGSSAIARLIATEFHILTEADLTSVTASVIGETSWPFRRWRANLPQKSC